MLLLNNYKQLFKEDETTHVIQKKLSQENVEEFAEEDKFLLFQGRIYVPAKLYREIIAEQHKLPIYRYQRQQKTLERIS